MIKIKKLLSRIIDENIIIVTAGGKNNLILLQGKLSSGFYKKLINTNPKWLKFEVTHITPRDNKLCVEVKNNSF